MLDSGWCRVPRHARTALNCSFFVLRASSSMWPSVYSVELYEKQPSNAKVLKYNKSSHYGRGTRKFPFMPPSVSGRSLSQLIDTKGRVLVSIWSAAGDSNAVYNSLISGSSSNPTLGASCLGLFDVRTSNTI